MESNVLLIFILGASIGSFINVIVYRVPKKKSIVFTRSKCTKCEYQLAWFDNIPIISWFLLLGKCRKCKANISIDYPIIEFLTAFLFVNQVLLPLLYFPEMVNSFQKITDINLNSPEILNYQVN